MANVHPAVTAMSQPELPRLIGRVGEKKTGDETHRFVGTDDISNLTQAVMGPENGSGDDVVIQAAYRA